MDAGNDDNQAGAVTTAAPGPYAQHARVYSELKWALVRATGKRAHRVRWQKNKPDEPGAAAGKWSHWGDKAKVPMNMGVVCGTSGLAVVEYDDADGEKRLLDLVGGDIPSTPAVRTGSGKLHIYFADPGGLAKAAKDGLELRVGGHFCLAPPSTHPDTGRPYMWVGGHEPWTVAPLPLPAAVIDFFQASNRAVAARPKKKLPKKIDDGALHDTIIRAAGAMRRKGFTKEATVAALVAEHNEKYVGADARDPEHDIRARIADIFDRYEAAGGLVTENAVPPRAEAPRPVEGDVDGAALLDGLVVHLQRYMVMSRAQTDVVVLFIIMTYCFDAFSVVPYLRVQSPTKKTGKSRLLELLEFTVRRPVKTGGISEAALFRSLAEGAVCLLFDEIGKVLGESARDRNSDIGAVLLNGFTAGTPVMRCVGEGTRQVVTPFEVFGPKVLGGTGKLEDAILDRCLVIALKRKSRDEQVQRFRRREANEIAAPLRARMQAWAVAHLADLARAEPNLPGELDDRAQDIVECLLAVADAAGGEWPHRARRAVVELRGGEVADDELGVELLADIRRVFDDSPIRDPLEHAPVS